MTRIINVMAKNRVKLSDQVRQAVEASGVSHYAIGKAMQIDKSAFSRFMSGRAGLSLTKLDALADVLGLDITMSGERPSIPQPGRGRPKKGG